MCALAILVTPVAEPLWFDIVVVATLAVFAVLGLFKGLAWQLGRLAMLAAAYGVALGFAARLAPTIAGWMDPATPAELPLHLAHLTLFVTMVILLGLLTWFVQRFVTVTPLTPTSRLLGGATGLLAGALVVLAVMTAIAMFLPTHRVARAAESSQAARVGRGALQIVEGFLPHDLGDGARQWRELLQSTPTTQTPPGVRTGEPVEGVFHGSDGASPQETPRKSVAPQKH